MLNRRALALATGAAAAIILGSLSPLTATAAPPEDKEQLRHERAVNYWTAERIANARPMDLLRVDPKTGKIQPQGKGGCNKRNPCGGGDTGGGDTGGGDGTEPIVDPGDPTQLSATTSQSWIGSGHESPVADAPVVTGKVLFTMGGSDYVCSGSVVADAVAGDDEALILTAGHCVNDGPNRWATNWTFFPDYGSSGADRTVRDCATTALGCWTASQLITSSAWADSGSAFDYDFAFARVGLGGHGELTSLEAALAAVEANPAAVAFGQPRNEFLAGFGYPAARPYDGRDLYYCAGEVTNPTASAGSPLGIPCDLTGGSSGGPWFQDFNAVEGVGTVVSLNSFKYRSDKGTMYGPYFGTYAEATYEVAIAADASTGHLAVPPPA